MGRVLTLVRAQMDMLQGIDDLQGFSLLSNAFSYMHGYPALAHHPVEEFIFSMLSNIHPPIKAVCIRLEEQHGNFSCWEAELLTTIRQAQTGDTRAFAQLRQLAGCYCSEMARHATTEEEYVFPLACRLLTNADFAEAASSFETPRDPLTSNGSFKRYDNLYDYLMEASQKRDFH